MEAGLQYVASDLELVEGVRRGCERSLEDLIGRYTAKIFNLAFRVTRCQEDAEEVMQDVFVTMFSKIGSFHNRSAFSSWIYRVTMNAAFMKVRARNRRKALSLEEIDPMVRSNWASNRSDASDLDFMSSRHEIRAALEEAIHELPEEYRLIFILRDVDGLSNQAVAAVTRLSVAAVKSKLHRSRVMLRSRLHHILADDEGRRIHCIM